MDCVEYNLPDIKNKINAGVELLGGWGRFVAAGMKVLLKVNLIGPKAPETAAITTRSLCGPLSKYSKAWDATCGLGTAPAAP